MKIYDLDMCDIHMNDNDNITIDITFDFIDWYNQNEIEMEMDRTVANIELVQQIMFKTPFQLNINNKEDSALSFSLDVDVVNMRVTEWTIFLYIKK